MEAKKRPANCKVGEYVETPKGRGRVTSLYLHPGDPHYFVTVKLDKPYKYYKNYKMTEQTFYEHQITPIT